jgi:Uma2 family endonuclease
MNSSTANPFVYDPSNTLDIMKMDRRAEHGPATPAPALLTPAPAPPLAAPPAAAPAATATIAVPAAINDWSRWYLTDEDDVGQSPQHWLIAAELCGLLEELARERGWRSNFVGGDQFIAWVREHPLVRVSPDVYLIDDPPAELPASWQTWLPGHRPPRFAVEVVSGSTWEKDYVEAPEKYSSMGASELVIADPAGFLRPGQTGARHERVPLKVYRRLGQDRFLSCVAAGVGPVYSAALDAYLVFGKDHRGEPRVRICRDPQGRDLVPTPAERADALAARATEAEARAEEAAARARAAEELLRKHGLI